MAPKKRAVAKATRSNAPATVVTRRGKEYATTAAASRPTRTAAQTDLSIQDTAPVRAPDKAAVRSTVKKSSTVGSSPVPAAAAPRKRGRPAKTAAVPVKRGRGRPPKSAAAIAPTKPATIPVKRGVGRPSTNTATSLSFPTPAKRGPGRPPKLVAATSIAKPTLAAKSSTTSKKRGRPAKETASNEPPKKRGRPSKASALIDAVPPEDEQPTPKRRGAPPHGGETTKIDSDDDAAAEQLEEELQEDVAEPVSTPKKRGRPAKGKGKAKQTVDKDIALQPSDVTLSQGRQYWLMKAEQDGHDMQLDNGTVFNTRFTIDDLRSKTAPEAWDGVRNPTAAKNMRAMRQGDMAFFYASGGKTPGIVGTMEIVREHEPDATAHDQDSAGYVKDPDKRDRWCVVHVEFRKKFSKPITRAELVAAKDAGPLSRMQEFTAARLSVSKVSEDEWEYIHGLIEDQENDELHQETDDQQATNSSIHAGDEALSGLLNGSGENVLPAVVEQGIDLTTLPNAASGAPAALTASAEDLPTAIPDSLFPPTDIVASSASLAAASPRPSSRGSRAGSAHRSLATKGASRTSSRAASRAGSVPRDVAPPGGRSRSNTPQHRVGSIQPTSGALMRAIGEE